MSMLRTTWATAAMYGDRPSKPERGNGLVSGSAVVEPGFLGWDRHTSERGHSAADDELSDWTCLQGLPVASSAKTTIS